MKRKIKPRLIRILLLVSHKYSLIKKTRHKRFLYKRREVRSPTVLDQTKTAFPNLPSEQLSNLINLVNQGHTLPFICRYRSNLIPKIDVESARKVVTELKRVKAQNTAVNIRRKCRQATHMDEDKQEIYSAETLHEVVNCAFESIGNDVCMHRLLDIDNVISDYINHSRRFANNLHKKLEKHLSFNCEKIAKDFSMDETISSGSIYDSFRVDIESIKPHQWMAIRRLLNKKTHKIGLLLKSRSLDFWIPDICKALAETLDIEISPNKLNMVLRLTTAAMAEGLKEVRCKEFCLQTVLSNLSKSFPEKLLSNILEIFIAKLDNEAENRAIASFRENIKQKLMLQGESLNAKECLLGIDPGYSKGNKCAVVDNQGKVCSYFSFNHGSSDSLKPVISAIAKFNIRIIAIGNGTGSSEVVKAIAGCTAIQSQTNLRYILMDECGISVYSVSDLAQRELPDIPLIYRSAVSLARRVLKPLEELCKVDPVHLGVGMYQLDYEFCDSSKTRFHAELRDAVQWIVSEQGIDVNTSCPELLACVPGLSYFEARNLYERAQVRKFRSKMELKEVLHPTTYLNVAGFLRILFSSEDPLDRTAVHPESYHTAKTLSNMLKVTDVVKVRAQVKKTFPLDQAMQIFTVIDQLEADKKLKFRKYEVLNHSDLKKLGNLQRENGSVYTGIIRNVADFGVFVEIPGHKRQGLVHKSKIPEASELVVGKTVKVVILNEKDDDKLSLGFA
jgi:transcriptional accessory protein Tex/SPT6